MTDRALMMTAVLICLASLPSRSGVAAEELTIGEQGVLKALGGSAPVIRLWPDGKTPDEDSADRAESFHKDVARKGSLLIRQTIQPSFLFLAAPASVNTGACVLLCPAAICPQARFGSIDFEPPLAVAKRLNKLGVSVVILKYRAGNRGRDLPRHHAALQDAQRAMSLLGAHAEDWKIQPDKIGVGGFSTGALVAALVANHSSKRAYEAVDRRPRVLCGRASRDESVR